MEAKQGDMEEGIDMENGGGWALKAGYDNVRNPASGACRQGPNFVGRKGKEKEEKWKKRKKKKKKGE